MMVGGMEQKIIHDAFEDSYIENIIHLEGGYIIYRNNIERKNIGSVITEVSTYNLILQKLE